MKKFAAAWIEQALDDLTNTFTNEPHAGEPHRSSSHRPPWDGAARRGHVQWLYVVNTLGSAREAHSPALYKEAPFDVCRSGLKNTYFQSWDEIKHNIIHRWVDLYDEADDVGLALFTDHTTSYVYGEDHPLSLTLAWGWEGGFWWGKRPLRGRQEVAYSIIPHAHRWEPGLESPGG